MSDMSNNVVPPIAKPPGIPSRKSFPDMVREYVVPYNSLLAVATFLCLVFSYLSPFLLTTFAVVLVTCVLQVIALDILAKDQLAAWAQAHSGLVADITASFWQGRNSSIFRTSPFWALVLMTVAVVFFTIRTDLA